MKKSISILILFVMVTAGAFAFNLSVGGGLLFDLSLNNGTKVDGVNNSIQNTSFGGFAFFDATYVEIDMSFAYGLLKYNYSYDGMSRSGDYGNIMQLNFGVLGKFPFNLGVITLFPLLGVNYNVALSGKYASGVLISDGLYYYDAGGESIENPMELMSQLGFLGGAGVDIFLSRSLYLRGEALFQLRLPAKEAREVANSNGGTATLGMGPRLKFGVGYQF